LDPQLRGPVSQAVSPDIAEYSKKFGVSQLLPNIKIGGGKFKEDGNAKKTRDKFLQDLIAGSLTALDAKKKDDKKTVTTGTTPQTTQQQQTQSNPTNPTTGSVSQRQQNQQRQQNGSQRPMDGQYKDDTRGADHGRTSVNEPNITATNVKQGVFPFVHTGDNQRYKVLLNYTNGDYEVFKVGAGLFGMDQPVDLSNPKPGGLNEALLRRAHKIVIQAYEKHAPGRGATVKYISPDKARELQYQRSQARNNKGEKGGNFKPAPRFDAGGGVQKPWWDFLGLVTGMKSIDQGKTGVYSDTLTGRMGNRTATTNKAIEEMLGRSKGFATGGSLFTPESEKAMTSLELTKEVQHLKNVTKIFGSTVIQITDVLSDDGSYSATPPTPIKSAPKVTATPPVAATAEENVDTGSAAIINVIAGGGGSQSIPMTSNNSSQTTVDYINDPWPAGLAGIVCTSPWSVV
jgi:hypothetical protein